jgi:hypothetical protein
MITPRSGFPRLGKWKRRFFQALEMDAVILPASRTENMAALG